MIVYLCVTCDQPKTMRTVAACSQKGHEWETVQLKREQRRGHKGPEVKWASVWRQIGVSDG